MIRGVKILGRKSGNKGREYTAKAIQESVSKYEGMRVNFDHSPQRGGRRSVTDRFGKLQNVEAREDGLYGDLRYNPYHPHADMVRWYAENEPSLLGLSHDALGRGHVRSDGGETIESIAYVRSVDLVADPATTKGLFEDMDPTTNPSPDPAPAPVTGGDDYAEQLGVLVASIMKDSSLSTEEKKKKILGALKLLDDETPAPSDTPKDSPSDTTESLRQELDDLKSQLNARELCESKNYKPTPTVLKTIARTPQAERIQLVEELAASQPAEPTPPAGGSLRRTPTTGAGAKGGTGDKPKDAKEFAKMARNGVR